MDYCLRNKPTRYRTAIRFEVPEFEKLMKNLTCITLRFSLFEGPVCGNGFVEPGEQCDCGLRDRCNNSCCNPITCTLHVNASCATGECCDLQVLTLIFVPCKRVPAAHPEVRWRNFMNLKDSKVGATKKRGKFVKLLELNFWIWFSQNPRLKFRT